ncbi:chromosome condensation regulator RCC1 [Streptomyces sp. NPDC053755]|uniref:RCC1 domain-containing protein n=1 Tax=Streptomyces sp. NPDC053755 TaxID=3155815 RepID=UPI00343C39ED
MTPHRRLSTTLLASLSLTALAVPAASAAATDPWVRTWGANAVGQLGNATTTSQPTPGDVTGLARTDVRKLSGGGDDDTGFAVALLSDGTVKSWGANAGGQLGNGTTTDQSVPTTVAGLSGISAADAGSDHALAVRKGRVHAWGSNAKGQLGNGLTEDGEKGMKKTPVLVQALDDVKEVGAGCQFSVALRQDGTVWTWGDGTMGRLGTGPSKDDETANESRNTPQEIQDLTDVTDISVGCSHVLALTVDGTVKAWGEGTDGMLGNDAVDHALAPVDVKLLKGVKTISAGTHNSFAILHEGDVKAWGKNDAGQLGDGTTTNRTTPVPIDKLKGTKSIVGGADFTLAAQPDGSVLTLGNNDAYQLGDGTNTPTTARDHTPVKALPAGSGITRVAVTTSGKSAYAY